jgi:hypothetical protein
MSTKYQIFISSTFDDLKDERAQVIKAVLEMGHIPVGMEMFSAADEEQWKLIARQIDETDYYVVIVGHRYGSITDGMSYTEKEFAYALSKGIPIYGFIVHDDVQPLAKNVDVDAKKKIGLSKFKNKVKQRPVSFWRSADDLHGKVSIALMKAFNTTPRTGWTRAVPVAGPEVSQELSRLSKENADLRSQLASATEQKANDLRAQRLSSIETLKAIPRTLQLRERGTSTWDIKVPTTLYRIFNTLGPELIVEKSVVEAAAYIALMNRPKDKTLSEKSPYATNYMKSLFADLHSIGLVEPSKKKHPISDKAEYWTLSTEGIELLKLERARKLELAAVREASLAVESDDSKNGEPKAKPEKKRSKPAPAA